MSKLLLKINAAAPAPKAKVARPFLVAIHLTPVENEAIIALAGRERKWGQHLLFVHNNNGQEISEAVARVRFAVNFVCGLGDKDERSRQLRDMSVSNGVQFAYRAAEEQRLGTPVGPVYRGTDLKSLREQLRAAADQVTAGLFFLYDALVIAQEEAGPELVECLRTLRARYADWTPAGRKSPVFGPIFGQHPLAMKYGHELASLEELISNVDQLEQPQSLLPEVSAAIIESAPVATNPVDEAVLDQAEPPTLTIPQEQTVKA